MSKFNATPIPELKLGDKVNVQLGNPTDTSGHVPSQELEVLRIEKTNGGWRFMGEWTKPNGEVQLCSCTVNHYGEEALAPYLCLNARTIGRMGGETRQIAINSLMFSPD